MKVGWVGLSDKTLWTAPVGGCNCIWWEATPAVGEQLLGGHFFSSFAGIKERSEIKDQIGVGEQIKSAISKMKPALDFGGEGRPELCMDTG